MVLNITIYDSYPHIRRPITNNKILISAALKRSEHNSTYTWFFFTFYFKFHSQTVKLINLKCINYTLSLFSLLPNFKVISRNLKAATRNFNICWFWRPLWTNPAWAPAPPVQVVIRLTFALGLEATERKTRHIFNTLLF